MPNYIFNKNSIIKFYKTLKFTNFETISPDRKEELEVIVNKWKNTFILNSVGLQTLMTYTAEKLTTSYKTYGLKNGDEIAYFYIKIVDPDFMFLEVYESSNFDDEICKYCMLNFHFYDKFLIHLEKAYNKYFKEFLPEDLWTRELIKK